MPNTSYFMFVLHIFNFNPHIVCIHSFRCMFVVLPLNDAPMLPLAAHPAARVKCTMYGWALIILAALSYQIWSQQHHDVSSSQPRAACDACIYDMMTINDTSVTSWPFMIIEDGDDNGRMGTKMVWQSMIRIGTIQRDIYGTYTIEWHHDIPITSKYSYGGRGMELSDVTMFNNELLAIDDRTGILFAVPH